MKFEDWLNAVPNSLKNDPIWKFAAYPKSLWLFDLVWIDCERFKKTAQGQALINQLIRSADSISPILTKALDTELNANNTLTICELPSVPREKRAAAITKPVTYFPKKLWNTE